MLLQFTRKPNLTAGVSGMTIKKPITAMMCVSDIESPLLISSILRRGKVVRTDLWLYPQEVRIGVHNYLAILQTNGHNGVNAMVK